jgi:hypothetical protein
MLPSSLLATSFVLVHSIVCSEDSISDPRLTCPSTNIQNLLRVVAYGRIEQLPVGKLQQHGMFHILPALLGIIVGDRVPAILEALVAAAVLVGMGVNARRRARGPGRPRLVALGDVELVLLAGPAGRLDLRGGGGRRERCRTGALSWLGCCRVSGVHSDDEYFPPGGRRLR